jgi:hypothetical protein
MKTREEQTSFLAYIRPHKSFTPSFLLALLAPLTAGSYSSLNQSLCQNEVRQILWTDTQFYEMVDNFTRFMNTLKLRLKQGLGGQIKAQKQWWVYQ